jgi:site-specific DNA recombinase
MHKVFAYVRVSTTRQGEKGVSLAEQSDAIRRFAERHELTIVRWFEEQQTAAKRGRPKFSEMVRLLRRGYAHGVVIHKIDRSARNLRDWADLGELIDAGVKVYFANENLDLASRGGRLTADIQAVVAADFIRNNREEVKKGLTGRLKQGLWPFGAPLGYLDRGKGKEKTIDPKKGPLVHEAFDLFATGRYTVATLLEEMTVRGLRNRNGRPLSKDGMWLMLRNSFYMGVMRIRRTGERFPGVHRPLIPASIFERVQAVLDGRSFTHLEKHDFVFRRLFHCATCGRSLTGSLQKGRVYYRCHTKSCIGASVREDTVETRVRTALRRITFGPELRALLHVGLRRRKEARGEAISSHRRSLDAELARVEARLTRLTDVFLDEAIDRELFHSRKTELLFQRAQIRERLEECVSDGTRLLQRADEKLQLAESAVFLYAIATPAEKRCLLDRITCNRVGAGRNVEISLLPPFGEVANVLDFRQCAHHQDEVATAEAILNIILHDGSAAP